MPIKHIKSSKTIKITCKGIVIDENWNFFATIDDATDYIKQNTANPSNYGFVVTEKEYWDFIP